MVRKYFKYLSNGIKIIFLGAIGAEIWAAEGSKVARIWSNFDDLYFNDHLTKKILVFSWDQTTVHIFKQIQVVMSAELKFRIICPGMIHQVYVLTFYSSGMYFWVTTPFCTRNMNLWCCWGKYWIFFAKM